jgi:hypothetical protein
MSQPSKSNPEDDVRKGGLRAILFGTLFGIFGLAFGSAVAHAPDTVYFSALVYFACGLGMCYKVSRLASVLTLGLFTSGIVTFLVYLSQSEPSIRALHS